MKLKHIVIVAILTFLFTLKGAYAFDSQLDCGNIVDFKTNMINGKSLNETSLQAYLSAYATKGKWNEQNKYYVLCFVPENPFTKQISNGFTLTASPSAPLLIYGLNLKMATAPATPCTQSLITISGANVTLQSATLAGPNACTAIQVNGAATIESATIGNFTEGIKVAKDASVKLAKNAFTITDPANAIVFDASVDSPIDSVLLGKKVDETDSTKAEFTTGKLNLDSCAGSVEMYYDPEGNKSELQILYHPTATCSLSNLAEDVTLKLADDHEEMISKGACSFKCDGFSEELKTKIAFAYTSASDQTYPFTPMPIKKFSDLGDVIFASAIPAIGPITSGADGTAVDSTTIVVPGYTAEQTETGAANTDNVNTNTVTDDQKDLLVEWTDLGDNPKTEKTETGGDTADSDVGGGQVSSGSGSTDGKVQATSGAGSSCGANISVAAPSTGGLIAQIMLLFGSLPIIGVFMRLPRRYRSSRQTTGGQAQ